LKQTANGEDDAGKQLFRQKGSTLGPTGSNIAHEFAISSGKITSMSAYAAGIHETGSLFEHSVPVHSSGLVTFVFLPGTVKLTPSRITDNEKALNNFRNSSAATAVSVIIRENFTYPHEVDQCPLSQKNSQRVSGVSTAMTPELNSYPVNSTHTHPHS
jgi:hypothetical protein